MSFTEAPTTVVDRTLFEDMLPWNRIAYLWHVVKGVLWTDPPAQKHEEREDIEWAVSALASGIRRLDWHLLVGRVFKQGDPSANPMKDLAQDKAETSVFLARLLPALKVVNERLHELAPVPFEGIAVVGENNEIVSNGYGLCIYETQEKADEMVRLWEQSDSGRPQNLVTKRVRVSLSGLEFL